MSTSTSAAIRYTADHIFDYIEIDKQHAIFEVPIPKNWLGKSIGELNIRKLYGINILGVKSHGETNVTVMLRFSSSASTRHCRSASSSRRCAMDIDGILLIIALLLFFRFGIYLVAEEDRVVRYLRKHGRKP